MNYIAPKVGKEKFTCPECNTLSQQHWWSKGWSGDTYSNFEYNTVHVSTCISCGKHTVWVEDIMVYPMIGNAPFPNTEMPDSVKSLYEEAASISNRSPRGAAALLRLGIQVLCKELGKPGKDINSDIASLVKDGLPTTVQQALDAIRVIGNHAVHPGKIDTDDPATEMQLFNLTNIIVEYMIAMPKQVSGVFDALPQGTREAIEKRDK